MSTEILFTDANAHFQGVSMVKQRLRSMQEVKVIISTIYYANVMWAVLLDHNKHFNEYLTIRDLDVTSSTTTIHWSISNLGGFILTMAGRSTMEILTFPREWKDAISGTHYTDKPGDRNKKRSGRGPGGRGGGGSNDRGGSNNGRGNSG